jgi:hypothetical protein
MATETKKGNAAPAPKGTAPKTDKVKNAAPIDNSPAAKTERFKKIAGRRTKKIIVTISNLGNCSNRNVYGYTPEQVDYIFSSIEKQLKLTKDKFAEKVAAAVKPDFELK